MTAKEYLKQAYRLHDLIRSNEKELHELEMLSVSLPAIDYSKERARNGYASDARYAEIIAKIDALERVIKADICSLLSLKLEIRSVIENVKNNDERLILKHRYINFMTWEQISNEVNLSLRTVHRIHTDALRNVKIPKIGTV